MLYKNKIFNLSLAGIFISLLCIFACIYSTKASELEYKITHLPPNETPEVSFKDKNEKSIYLEDYEGHNLLVVFWATWSAPSIDEMKSLERLAKDFRKLPIKIITISEDFKGLSTALDFANKHELRHLEIFYDPGRKLFEAFNVTSLPTRFIVGPDGKYDTKIEGIVNWDKNGIRNLLLDKMGITPEARPKNSSHGDSLQKLPAGPNSTLKGTTSKEGENKLKQGETQGENNSKNNSGKNPKTPAGEKTNNSKNSGNSNEKFRGTNNNRNKPKT